MKLDKTIFLFTILLFIVPSAAMAGEIVVTDADSVWSPGLIPAPSDVIDSTDTPPQNLIKYAFVSHADSVWNTELMKESGWEAPPVPTYNVAVILAEPSDVEHISSPITAKPCKLLPQKTYLNGHNKEYYQDLLYCVTDYHKENSFEKVNLNFEIYDDDGEWFKIPEGGGFIFIEKTIDLVKSKGIDLSVYDATIIVTAKERGNAFHLVEFEKTTGQLISFSKIKVGENDPVGIWAHEIGHFVGAYITPENTATPDLYDMGNVGKWDLMAKGAWNGGPFDVLDFKGDGTNPSHMSSFTKEFLGWLNYDIHPKSAYGEYWINSLETSDFGDKVFRYNLSNDTNDESSKYYILETRNRNLKTWDSSLPGLPVVGDKNLVLYYVDTKGFPEYGYDLDKKKMMIDSWTVTIPANGFFEVNDGILNPLVNETYRDLDNLVKFSAITDRTVNDKYEIQARIGEIAYDSFSDKFWGVILRPGSILKEKIEGKLILKSPYDNNLLKAQLASVCICIKDAKTDQTECNCGDSGSLGIKELVEAIANLTFSASILLILLSLLLLCLDRKVIPRWKSERKKKIAKIIFRIVWTFTLIIFLLFITFSLVTRYWVSKKPTAENFKTIASPSSAESDTLPDLDLHLYCGDGRHVGMNYETGEYEIQISDAMESGDNQNSPEWIFIPKDITGCHFAVSSYDNQKFLEENPEIAKDIIDTTDNYEIYGRFIDPATGIYTSQTLTEQPINPGENIIHQTTGTADIAVSQGVVDNQGPIITHIELKPEYLLNSPAVTFNFSAQDEGVGVKEITATLDSNSLTNGQNIAFDRVGAHTIAITASDFLGNTTEEKISFNVVYSFGGFLPPVIDGSGVYKLGRTLPVKFQLTDANHNYVSIAIATLFLFKVSDGIPGGEEIPLSTSNADTGNQFRYAGEDNQYIYNLSTESLNPGTWQLRIKLDDGKSYNVLIAIKK